MLDKFLEYLRYEKRYSEHTLGGYRRDVMQFFDFYGSTVEEAGSVHSRNVRAWIVELMECGNKATTVNRKLSSLRTFYSFLQKNQTIKSSPMIGLNGPKQEKRLGKSH